VGVAGWAPRPAGIQANPVINEEQLRAEIAKLKARVDGLLQEKLATARAMHAEKLQMFQDGRGTLEFLVEGIRQLRDVELELTDDALEQLAILDRHLHVLREVEKVNQERFDAGRVPIPDVMQSKAERLGEEIELVRARGRAGKEKDPQAITTKLLQEKVKALRTVHDARRKEFEAGRGTLDFLLKATTRVLEAEVQLTDDPKKHLELHEKRLQACREAEKINKERFEAMRIPIQDYAQTQAARAEAEIAWLRARCKAAKEKEPQAAITKLLQEIVETAKTEHQARVMEFQAGRGMFDFLLAATRRLRDAELQLSDDPKKQLAVHEKHFKAFQEFEKVNAERFAADRILSQDLAQAKIARLEAEIALVRAKMRVLAAQLEKEKKKPPNTKDGQPPQQGKVELRQLPKITTDNKNTLIRQHREKLTLTASSTYPGWPPDNAFDANAETSWFSTTDDSAAKGKKPWLEVTFPTDVTVHRVTILGNRDPAWLNGYTILAGSLEFLDKDNKRIHYEENEGTGNFRDFDFQLARPLAGVRSIRFTSLGDQGNLNPYGDIAIAEFQVE
jgi:hypothetical protein